MSFIVRCPHASRGKCVLPEDAERGAQAACLLCKKAVAVDSCSWAEPLKIAALPTTAPGAPPVAERPRIVNCPQCSALQRTGPNREQREIICLRCKNVFTR